MFSYHYVIYSRLLFGEQKGKESPNFLVVIVTRENVNSFLLIYSLFIT